MDKYTAQAIPIFGLYIAAYALACVVGLVGISNIVRLIANKYLNEGPIQKLSRAEKAKVDKSYGQLASIIGSIESAMYTTSVLLGRPEFIGVWLLLKAVGEWRQNAGVTPGTAAIVGTSKEYTVFLIGNALNVSLGVFTALLIQHLLPPFPELSHWRVLISSFIGGLPVVWHSM